MIIDIYPGKYFCRWKLLFATNIYFHQSMFERFVGSKDSNYILRIYKHSIKIFAASTFSKEDEKLMKDYIEAVFRGGSILIDATDEIPWINDIQDVQIFWN